MYKIMDKHQQFNKFDRIYVKTMAEYLIFEDVIDAAAKFNAVSNEIKKYVGIALQSFFTQPNLIAILPVLDLIGRKGLSQKLFGEIGKQILKHSSWLSGGATGVASGTSAGTAGGGAGGGAVGAVGAGVGAVPGAAVGAATGGVAGGISGGGAGTYIGFAVRKVVGALGQELFGFFGACNDYVSKNKLNPIVNKILLRKKKKQKVDDVYGVEVDECVQYLNELESGIISEGLISKIKEKITKFWDKIVQFFKEFLSPVVKTIFYMAKITFQKYKIYGEISSDEEYNKVFLDTLTTAMSKAKAVDTDNFKTETILRYFFDLKIVKILCVKLFKEVVETIKKMFKSLKDLKNYFFKKKDKKDEKTSENKKEKNTENTKSQENIKKIESDKTESTNKKPNTENLNNSKSENKK